MTLHQLSAAPSATQIKALLRGLPARALHECAVLVGLSPSRLARMLRCTRQPRRRYRLYPSEKLLRLAVLRREFDRVFGEHAIAKMQAPVPSFGGASALEFAVTETGFRVVREFLAGDDDVMRASAAQAGARLDAEEARALRLANRLPADRVLRVAQLVLRSQGRGRLPVAELNTLVARLAAAPSRASGDAIRQQIIDGFYGPMKKRLVREMVGAARPRSSRRPEMSILEGIAFGEQAVREGRTTSHAEAKKRLALSAVSKSPPRSGYMALRPYIPVCCDGVMLRDEWQAL